MIKGYRWSGVAIAVLLMALIWRGGWLWSVASMSTPTAPIQVYPVDATLVAVEFNLGAVVHAQQTPYQAEPGDRIVERDDQPWVRRNQTLIGNLVGPNHDLLYGFDRYEGDRLDPNWADQSNHYRLASENDPNYRQARQPGAVFRKSKPTDMAQLSRGELDWPVRHRLYLRFSQPLSVGKTYTLSFERSPLALSAVTFRYNPQRQWSEAVHVSQLGFRPDDPVKVGFLSLWVGNGGPWDYPDGLGFSVIDQGSDRIQFTGQAQLTKGATESEDPRDRNYTLTNVYSLDFSDLRRPGCYRLCVATVGCSLPFAIAPDIWKTAYRTVARGFYHQRSGIPLTQPYTDWTRPRPFHPDDTPIYQARTTLMETTMGIGEESVFDALQAETSKTPVPEAWGGYFDAGDWDRRIQHLEATRLQLELVEIAPRITQLGLNIPQDYPGLPDLVNEALWNLDFFRRLQLPNGGVRGGIESSSHPHRGEASWQNTLPTYVYGPDLWSSYVYAGGAAQIATILKDRAPDLAQTYGRSAIAAMTYAEAARTDPAAAHGLNPLPHAVNDARNLAAVELYRLTGESRWHDLFLQTTVFDDPDAPTMQWARHHQRDAAFVYARLRDRSVDSRVQRQARRALIKEADIVLAFSQQTGLGWAKDDPYQPIGWGSSFGAPKAIALIRAHVLTGQAQYYRGAIAVSQFALGANPDNMTTITGLGHHPPQNPLIIDARIQAQAPPPGIPVYGPLDVVKYSHYWTFDRLRPVTFPDPSQWPTTEAYFDIFLFPAVTEFTVMQSMGPTTYAWGYLAATDPPG
ncbi:glycoside hydrolase family 9 protein [Spirulina major CS-329]|uniref:glycoside hydrolase family 9 protein n=1 Tax=Spirulina TaxID=1154 RepID=UPI0023301FC9|nr:MULTISPECIES: glycoside hydrolase family 9 protein [Spirulina]MDB9493670.1 glycoside hydrolase family 9 protein [Spirulina subsalsa CS-330]MDB9502215.1 glycoside hydrolase family 9 protein [Spirulina major CS-329]